MDEDELLTLTFQGAVDVARWTCRAWESKNFDWNKLAGDNSPENIRERWAVVRWWNDQHLLDCLNEPNSEDRELEAAICFAFVTTALRKKAEEAQVTPQDYMDLALQNAELTEGMSGGETAK